MPSTVGSGSISSWQQVLKDRMYNHLAGEEIETWKSNKAQLHSEAQRRLVFSFGIFKGGTMDGQEVMGDYGHTPGCQMVLCFKAPHVLSNSHLDSRG